MTQQENQPAKAETLQGRNMARKPKNIRGVIRVRHWMSGGKKRTAWQADFGEVNGKRLMKSYEAKVDAQNWLREQTLLHEDQGAAGVAMTDAQRLDAVKARDELKDILGLPKASLLETIAKTYKQCRQILRSCNATLEDAAAYYAKHKEPTGERRTVNEVAQEYIEDAKQHNLRPTSIKDIEHRLNRFVMRFDKRLITEITRRDAKDWIDALKDKAGKEAVSASSKRHASVIAHGMYNYAIDHDYVTENPFTEISKGRRKYREDEAMPECLTCQQVQQIMNAAKESEETMVPALAIGFFAGLRTAELKGLDWKSVDLVQNRITVIPEVAKKRRARHVEIEGNLLQWLTPYRKQSGLVAPDGEKWRSRLDAIREKAKVKWPHNAMRHSYASHHLAKYGDPVKTAFALGHQHDTGMLFEHYRALTTPEDGLQYFLIKPESKGNLIHLAKTA